jgi:hypothetical protein
MPLRNSLKKLMELSNQKSRKKLAAYEKQIITEYKKALTEMKAELAKYYENNWSTQRLSGVIDKIEKTLKDAGVKGLKTTKKGVKEAVEYNFNAVQENLRTVVGNELSFAILNPNVANSLIVNNKFAKINWQTKGISNINKANEILRTQITQGVLQGKNYEVVAREITKQLNISVSDALRIVKTESHRASNEARLLSFEESEQAAKELGFKQILIWECMFMNSRPEHEEMNGVIADENGIFTFPDGTTTEGPGLSGAPEHDINCNCDIVFDLEEV